MLSRIVFAFGSVLALNIGGVAAFYILSWHWRGMWLIAEVNILAMALGAALFVASTLFASALQSHNH